MVALCILLRMGSFYVGATSISYATVATHEELSGLSHGLGARVCLVLMLEKNLGLALDNHNGGMTRLGVTSCME